MKAWKLTAIGLTLGLTCSTAASAEPSWRDFPGVTNTSYVEPNGDRAIQLSIDVPAPQQSVFEAFATTKGFKSWAVPVAQIELRVGGMIESNYNGSAVIGDRNNIKNEITAYVPGRLLVLRNVQAPSSFVDPELFQKTVTIIEFTAIDTGHTRVTVTNAGFGPGARYARLYNKFEWADAYTLDGLRSRFVSGPVDWTKGEPQATAAASTQAVEEGRK